MNSFLIATGVGYCLGSIPFGLLLVRAFRGRDIRTIGSGNIGATNVARFSPRLGLLTLALDGCKGLAAVAIVRGLFPGAVTLAATAAFFAIVGHVFPLWLRFRGGKGVATGLGSFILLAPKIIVLAVAIFIAILFAFRYVSLASIVAVGLFPVLAFFLLPNFGGAAIALLSASAALIVARHHSNVRRLIAGTEPRFQVSKR